MLEEIIRFKNSKEWIEFEKYYNGHSLVNQFGISHFEDENTNFLCALLKPDNTYKLGTYPLQLLIELLKCKDRDNQYFSDIDVFEHLEFQNVNSETRKTIDGKLIPDMLIEFRLNKQDYLIVLEAKLFSSERTDQCKDYRKSIEENEYYSNHKKIYVFLSLDSNAITSDDEHYLKITYQDFMDRIYFPCSLILNDSNLKYSFEEYFKGFTCIYEYYDNSEKKLDYYVISPPAKSLTCELWKEHSSVLMEILKNNHESISFIKNNKFVFTILLINLIKLSKKLSISDEEHRQIADSFFKYKNSITISFDNNPCSKTEFIYVLFKKLIDEEKYGTYDEIPNQFKYFGSWPLVVPKDCLNAHDYAYRLFKGHNQPLVLKDGTELCYCHYYNDDDIKEIRDRILSVYPKYKNRIQIKERL